MARVLSWLVGVVAFGLFGAMPASANDADFKALIAAERAFAARAEAIGWRQAFAEYFADDNLMLLPGPTLARPLFQTEQPTERSVTWGPSAGEVAASGELGYTYGNAVWRSTADPAAPATGNQFLSLWQRDAKGRFRNVFDIGVTHEPVPVASTWQQRGARRANPARLPPAAANTRLQELVLADRALARALAGSDTRAAYADIVTADVAWLRDGSTPRLGPEHIPQEATHPALDLATLRLAASGDLGFSAGWNGDASTPVQYARIWRYVEGRWRLALDLLARTPPA